METQAPPINSGHAPQKKSAAPCTPRARSPSHRQTVIIKLELDISSHTLPSVQIFYPQFGSLQLKYNSHRLYAAMQRKKLDLDALLAKIVELMLRHPPSDLSFSMISRLTKVPRSTLYYYFGSSLEKMIEEAVKFGMESFVQLVTLDKEKNFESWKSFQKTRLWSSVDLIKKYSWAPGLYFRYRNDPGPLGKRIRETENAYVHKMITVWKHYTHQNVDPRSVRLASYLKLGFLWGLGNDSTHWFPSTSEKSPEKSKEKDLDHVVDIMTDLITEIMQSKL